MRTLHIYSGNLFGGVESMLLTLAQSRHIYPAMESQFALCFNGRLSRDLKAAGATMHRLHGVRTSRFWTVRRARHDLRTLLQHQRFDVAICHAAWSQAIFAPVIHRAALPQVFWQHDIARGKHWIERWARRTPPDIAIGNSSCTINTLPTIYANIRAEQLCYPVVMAKPTMSLQERDDLRASLGAASDTTVIIQASRMEDWKGHTLHLQALKHLRHLPNWVCWLIGGAQRAHEMAYVARLKAMTRQYGIADRVHFLGQRSDVARLMAAADIHCQPNRQPEPFGIAFVEALSAGLPVVSTAMGGALEIVDASCGVLVPPGDDQALSEALQRLIASPTLRAQLGAAGPARAHALCAPVQQIERLYTLLNNLVHQKVNA